MDGLRQKLESQGLKDVVYMVINHQGEPAQRLHPLLVEKLSQNIMLYKQDEQQTDVWQTLNGEKDDFFIYDRCGRLTHQISLPYSIIGQGHVEGAIKDTYCKRICGECSHESAETPEECKGTADAQPDAESIPAAEVDTGHGHGLDHDRGHHHGHHHGHGHHGHHGVHHEDGHGFHPRGLGRDQDRGHHHGNHDGAGHGSHHGQSQGQGRVRLEGQGQEGGMSQGQQQIDFVDVQQAVHTQHMSQEAHDAPARP